jgi:hypothetical protein
MKYFEQYLLTNPLEEIDISVHCDVQIFEWLMQYMLGDRPPELDTNNVISILISSDFLQMEQLVAECVKFVKNNLEDVVKLPIDMNCLNDKLLRQVANLFKDAELDEVKDRKDKLVGKLFVAKLKMMLEDESKVLNKCVYCSKLFTNAQREWMVCEKAKIFIDFHGKVIAEHVPDRNWDINKFIMFLETQGLTWRDIYWKVWGRLISFQCLSCAEHFVGNEMRHCSYHPLEPKFNIGSNIGNYQCCNQQAVRFDTSIKKKGCAATSHQIKPDLTHTEEYEILTKKFEVIEEPFAPSSDDKRSLISMVKLFVNDKDDLLGSEDDPDELDQEEEELTDSDEERDSMKRKMRKIKKSKTKKSEINPVKQRVWKLDHLRLEDFVAMKELGQKLVKLRKKPEKNVKPTVVKSKK